MANNAAVTKFINEIKRMAKELPPRPLAEEVKDAKTVIKNVREDAQSELDTITKEIKPKEIPEELFYVYKMMQTSLIRYRSKEKMKETVNLVDLENEHKAFDEMLQRAFQPGDRKEGSRSFCYELKSLNHDGSGSSSSEVDKGIGKMKMGSKDDSYVTSSLNLDGSGSSSSVVPQIVDSTLTTSAVSETEIIGKVAPNWVAEWENCMVFFYKEEVKIDDIHKVYVVNTETLKAYYVVDFPKQVENLRRFGCAYSRGKLYLVGDLNPNDVYVCDLSLSPYVWTVGPPLRSVKHYPHLVAYNGMIFALSSPDRINYPDPGDPIATFEVWDTNKSGRDCWEVLPDPPLKDYNPSGRSMGAYTVVSHVVLNDLFYFVFDYNYTPPWLVDNKDSNGRGPCATTPLCYSKVEPFDPSIRQWVRSYVAESNSDPYSSESDNEEDKDDMLSMFINFSARRHHLYDGVLEFFKGDDSLRMFLLDPAGSDKEIWPLPPCFYTYDKSTFDSKTILKALREAQVWFDSFHKFSQWFQSFVRPYLSSVTGLSRLMEALRERSFGGHACFVLPCSHIGGCWNFRVVAFLRRGERTYASVSKFRLEMVTKNCFQAHDLEIVEECLVGGSTRGDYFRI